jgi:hypothetical protein
VSVYCSLTRGGRVSKYSPSSISLVCRSNQQGISFDDIPAFSTFPIGYAGFHWSNLEAVNGSTVYNGYNLNLYYGRQFAYNTNLNPINISRINGTFSLRSLLIPFLWIHELNITIAGSSMGTVIYSGFYHLNRTYTWIVSMNWSNIDTLTIASAPSPSPPQMTIDDLCIIL